jgi:tripartite-type tricarboxylate transporter receptor subunit TctC
MIADEAVIRERTMVAIVRLIAVLVALACAGPALAQMAPKYPNRNVRVIVPYPAGGPTDVIGRMVAQHLSESIGQGHQFYVDNVGGGGGVIGFTTGARATPDGYTILITTNDIAVAPATTKNLQYDPVKSFTPISIVAVTPQVVVAHPSIPAKNLKELVALIISDPTKYNYATMSVGFGQLSGIRLFQLAMGLDIPRVPFSGAAPMMTSILGNQTPIAMIGLPPTVPHIKAGKMRGLGVSRHFAALPDIPTFAEMGYPDQDADLVIGAVAPAGTPKPIVDLIQREIAKAVEQPDVKLRLDALGFTGVASTPEAFAAQMKSDAALWPKVMEAAGMKNN